MTRSSRVLIRAPCNLGLRPLGPGHEPGTWRAPQVLTEAGLVNAPRPDRIVDLPRPAYDPGPQAGTRLRNGQTLRVFNLMLADAAASATVAGEFPVVVGETAQSCSERWLACAATRRCRWFTSMDTATSDTLGTTTHHVCSVRWREWILRWQPGAARR
jgi:hypothetical protein